MVSLVHKKEFLSTFLVTFNFQPMFKQVVIFLIILESIVSTLLDHFLTLIILNHEILQGRGLRIVSES